MKQKVLVVEDEKSIQHFVSTILSANGYEVISAASGQEAYRLISVYSVDVVILDLGLPDMDGSEVLRAVRGWSSVPIIVVSARANEREKVAVLDLGADDYITKPFGTDELLARIRMALRHQRATGMNAAVERSGRFYVKELMIDYEKYRVFRNGEDVGLTQNEFKIVSMLGKHAGKVLTYDYLLKEIWGSSDGNNYQILRVNMANIRRKIEKNPAEPEYLFTEVGVGYRMAEDD